MSVRQLKKPGKDGKRPWIAELPNPKRPGRTIRIGTYPTETDAKDAEFEAEKKRREGRLATNKNTMTVADLRNHFLAHSKERRDAGALAGGTLKTYRYHLTHHVIPIIGDVKLRDLKKSVIQRWYYEVYKRVPTGTVPQKIKCTLVSAVNYAADEERGWISPGDALLMFRRLDAPKRKPRRTHAKLDDLKVFLEHQRRRFPEDELPTLIALTTGMRLGEVTGLQYERCDMVNRRFLVECFICKSPSDGQNAPRAETRGTASRWWSMFLFCLATTGTR